MEKFFLSLGESSNLTLGDIIKELRVRRGLSSRSMSELCGLSPAYISKVENGATMPSSKILVRILKKLQCNSYEILYILGAISKEESDEV